MPDFEICRWYHKSGNVTDIIKTVYQVKEILIQELLKNLCPPIGDQNLYSEIDSENIFTLIKWKFLFFPFSTIIAKDISQY